MQSTFALLSSLKWYTQHSLLFLECRRGGGGLDFKVKSQGVIAAVLVVLHLNYMYPFSEEKAKEKRKKTKVFSFQVWHD